MAKETHSWQSKGLVTATEKINDGENEISVSAGVGSGKTYFAARLAKILLEADIIDQIIVITINRRCQLQWCWQMKELEMPLFRLSGNSNLTKGIPADVKGYVGTYAGMGSYPDLHAAYCGRCRTLVIFDEVHHINEDDNTSWGKAAVIAFNSSEIRLSLSGTYFSSNGAPIPFARMKVKAGSSVDFEYDPQIEYTYGQSVADGICRRIVFKPFDGPIEYRYEGDEHYKATTFRDPIDEKYLGARLWAACNPFGESGQPNNMLGEMLFKANRLLMDLRAAGHTRAGGLIVCNDTVHARRIRAEIEKISGHRAVLVLNDEPGSTQALDSFANGFIPWLVAVRMVTEGVDIPRLRVGVYLTNAVKELTFIQFLGRHVRHFKGNERERADPAGEAYVFYPEDERLVKIAAVIEEEVQVAITSKKKQDAKDGSQEETQRRRYESGTVEGEEKDNLVAGSTFTVEEIETAEQLRKLVPQLGEAQILDMLQFVRLGRNQSPRPRPSPVSAPVDNKDDHESLRQVTAKLAKKVAVANDHEFKDVHVAANKACGIDAIETATVEELRAKKVWLEERLAVNLDPDQLREALGK